MSCLALEHIYFLESPFPTIVGLISKDSPELQQSLKQIQHNGNDLVVYDLNLNKITTSGSNIRNVKFLCCPGPLEN